MIRRAVAAAVVLAALVAPVSALGGSLPTLLTQVKKPNNFQVRPREVIFTSDGSGILGYLPPKHRGHLHWKSWTKSSASAAGTLWIDDCRPDCARGSYHSYAAGVRADDVRGGRYAHLTIRFVKSHRHLTLRRRLARNSGTYYWAAG